MKVEVRRARRGLSLRNQFRVAIISGSDELVGSERYTNHRYAVSVAKRFADALKAEFVDTTGIA